MAAKWLTANGYKNVSVLFNGIDAVLSTAADDLPGKWIYLEQKTPCKVLAVTEISPFLNSHPDRLILDVRTKEEFSNQAKDSWRNIGQIKDAINIASADLPSQNDQLTTYKNKPIIIYAFTTGDEVYTAAKKLVNAGYKDVNILAGGLFNLRWTAHNIKGKEGIDAIVVNVPEVNL